MFNFEQTSKRCLKKIAISLIDRASPDLGVKRNGLISTAMPQPGLKPLHWLGLFGDWP